MLRNFIFDWSGTLMDDLPAVWLATHHVFDRAGVPPLTMDRFRAEFSLPFQEFYERFIPHADLPQLEEWFHGRFREVQDQVRPMPHARAFLEFCRARRCRTFVLSTIHRSHYAVQSIASGLGEFIDRPYVEAWDKREWIHHLMEENQLSPAETVFIGDMAHDVETAHHGGVYSCAVLTGYNSAAQLRKSGPHLMVEHLGELQRILEDSGMEFPTAWTGGAAGGRGMRPGHATAQPPAAVGQRPVGTVGALIFNAAGQVLMIRTHKWCHLWGIPGGKIEYGETSEAALVRELKEETGLDVHGIQFVMVQDCIESAEFHRPAHFILLNYSCRVHGTPAVTLNEEAEEYRWLDPEAAARLELNQPTRRLLQRVRAEGCIPCV